LVDLRCEVVENVVRNFRELGADHHDADHDHGRTGIGRPRLGHLPILLAEPVDGFVLIMG